MRAAPRRPGAADVQRYADVGDRRLCRSPLQRAGDRQRDGPDDAGAASQGVGPVRGHRPSGSTSTCRRRTSGTAVLPAGVPVGDENAEDGVPPDFGPPARIAFGADSGAYTVQTNGGGGYRVDAAAAKFSKTVAAALLRDRPAHLRIHLRGQRRLVPDHRCHREHQRGLGRRSAVHRRRADVDPEQLLRAGLRPVRAGRQGRRRSPTRSPRGQRRPLRRAQRPRAVGAARGDEDGGAAAGVGGLPLRARPGRSRRSARLRRHGPRHRPDIRERLLDQAGLRGHGAVGAR